jgi:group I intron endonuclease
MDFKNVSGIYCFENLINGKKYIGQAANLKDRINKHIIYLRKEYDGCIALQNAWSFYGKENFNIYIIEECNIELLNEKEIYYIKTLHSHISEHGYNISWGGEYFFRGMHHSEESKRKISENSGAISGELSPQYGKKLSEETKKKVSQSLFKYYESHHGAMLGKNHSEESKKKMSESRKGEKNWLFRKHLSEETKNKISKSLIGNIPWNKGISMSEEFKKKNSEIHLGQKAWNKGIPHTEEDKIKMSKAHKGVPLSKEHSENISKANVGKKRKGSSSKYIGVCFLKESKKWKSSFYYLNKLYSVGIYCSEIEAALEYNKKAIEVFGENAKLNIFTEEELNIINLEKEV